jgi:hypothetical protein
MFWTSGKRRHWPPVYRKPTYTGRCLNLNSNHPSHVKICLIQSLHIRASTLGPERQDPCNEISSLRRNLKLNCYPQSFTKSVINSQGSCRQNKEEKPPTCEGSVREVQTYRESMYIRMIFKAKHTFGFSLMKIRPEGDPQQMAQCLWVAEASLTK